MNPFRCLWGLGMLLLAWTGHAAEPLSAEANVPIEIAFTAQRPHPDPFNQVRLDVQVTAPDGTAKNVPAFWAGGAVWKVRYASPQAGLHRWRTACSDPQDAGLHGVDGTLDIQAYRGENPLYRRGAIRVAACSSGSAARAAVPHTLNTSNDIAKQRSMVILLGNER